MMNSALKILSLFLLLALGFHIMAQQKTAGNARKLFVPPVYLGQSDYKGGAIQKNKFDELLKQGLTSHDSLGNRFKVVGFQFSYAERNVYEDSAGNLQMLTDYSYEYCPGDTITPTIASSIYDRTKPGDTIYFDRITVVRYLKNSGNTLPDSTAIAARGMKFFIIK